MTTIPVVVQINASDMPILARLVEYHGTIEAAMSALLSCVGSTQDPREYDDLADWAYTGDNEVTVYTCFGRDWYLEPAQVDLKISNDRGQIGAMEMPLSLARSIEGEVGKALQNYYGTMGFADREPTWGELRTYAWKHYYPGAVKFTWTQRNSTSKALSRFLGLELPEILPNAPQAEPIKRRVIVDYVENWDAATYLTVKAHLGPCWHVERAEVTPKLATSLGEDVRRFRNELKRASEAYTEQRIINISQAQRLPTWGELHCFLVEQPEPLRNCANLSRFLGLELFAAERARTGA